MKRRAPTLIEHQQITCDVLGIQWLTDHHRRSLVRVLRELRRIASGLVTHPVNTDNEPSRKPVLPLSWPVWISRHAHSRYEIGAISGLRVTCRSICGPSEA
jgi:hypothetical protein